MQSKKRNELGAIMVEVIAVIALLGVMGTVLFRHIKQRNDELDNINMASEIRVVKDATAAYIQANHAYLAANCGIDSTDGYGYKMLDNEEVDAFMPDNWACDFNSLNCLIHDYEIAITCYSHNVGEVDSDNRISIYGTIVPKVGDEGPLPADFNLRRAARVANLIGSDGGVLDGNEKTMHGTMGAWEVDCPGVPEDEFKACFDRQGEPTFVATTGMDIFIPEADLSAENAVAVPDSVALNRLHATSYFSVGSNGTNCVTNYDHGSGFAHHSLSGDTTVEDNIAHVGENGCDPLFWVGTKGGEADHSESGRVYVKNSLTVGRDNANNKQAFTLETGTTDSDRHLTVYNTDGKGTITLDAMGRVMARNDGEGRGYRLDAKTGEIVLFKEVEMNVGGQTGKVQIPTVRLTDGRLETSIQGEYYDSNSSLKKEVYAVDPANTSLMHDIRLTSRGGARLSEILPDYIAKGIYSITQNSDTSSEVTKPTCPKGYVRAVTVMPIQYSQYVKAGQLTVNAQTTSGTAAAGHTHTVNFDTGRDEVANDRTLTIKTDGANPAASLTLEQKEPVSIAINGTDNAKWKVTMTYGSDNPTSDDPITALAHTYCVFDKDNFEETNSADYATTGIGRDAKEAGILTRACQTEADCKSGYACVDTVCRKTCSSDSNCSNTEKCVSAESSSTTKICRTLGTCSEDDGVSLGGNIYCYDEKQIYLECVNDTQCGPGKICSVDNRCEEKATP